MLICEADQCAGPVLDLPLEAIGAARGDPTNVDVAGPRRQGIPVLRAPGRNADAVAELAVGLLLAATRGLVAADRDVREGQVYRDGSIPTSASGPGSWRAGPRAWSAWARWAGPPAGAWRAWGCG